MLDLLKEDLNYKVKIDVPNIVEIISETFDDVLNHMLPGMLVFGGALRDIIAGFGLHHDLDIATSSLKGKEFIHYLETSSKWMEECVITQYKEQAKVMESKILDIISPHSMENGMLDLNRNFSYNTKSRYGNALNVRTFINFSGQKLQIITSKSDLFTLKENPPIIIAKTVDFICCGLIMDTDGNVYEVIEGAKNDCVEKILRVNKNVNVKFHSLSKRIEKFTARGWKSQIDLTKIKYKQARLKKAAEKRERETEKQSNKSLTNYIYKHILSSGEIQIIINTSKMQTFRHCRNSNVKTLELFYSIFRNYHLNRKVCSCRVSSSYNEHKHVVVCLTNKDANIILELEKALLHKERKFLLSDQKYETRLSSSGINRKILKSPGRSSKDSLRCSKVLDLPYQYPIDSSGEYSLVYDAGFTSVTSSSVSDANLGRELGEEIEWVPLGRDENKPAIKSEKLTSLRQYDYAILGSEEPPKQHDHAILKTPAMAETISKDNSTKPTAKTKLVENNSDIEVTKKEKMGIEYGAHLIDNRAQISKHFAGKQIKSLNTEEKKALAKYMALKL